MNEGSDKLYYSGAIMILCSELASGDAQGPICGIR